MTFSSVYDKCMPFFKVLKKANISAWDKESDKVFDQIKKYLAKRPLTNLEVGKA